MESLHKNGSRSILKQAKKYNYRAGLEKGRSAWVTSKKDGKENLHRS